MTFPEPTPYQSPNGRPGWRDVLSAVQESEERLTRTMERGFRDVKRVQIDHETRLRELEDKDRIASGRSQGRAQVVGVTRGFVVAVVAVAALIAQVVGIAIRGG